MDENEGVAILEEIAYNVENIELKCEENDMKKIRPYCAGLIVVYVLAALSFVDSGYTAYCQITGKGNQMMTSMSMFSYLITVVAVLYVRLYAATKTVLTDKTMRIVFPVYIRPPQGAKRALFIYRQGDTDMKLVDKTFNLADIDRYGYIEDLGYDRLDASGTGENNKLFPVHEMAIVMKDGKRYHTNMGYYKEQQIKEILQAMVAGSGVKPTGKIAKVLGK